MLTDYYTPLIDAHSRELRELYTLEALIREARSEGCADLPAEIRRAVDTALDRIDEGRV